MSARLKSAIFVSAVIRNVNAAGGFAAVLRHGADDGGAIFITVPRQTGSDLYAQAPQTVLAEGGEMTGGRVFERIAGELDSEGLQARFDKEARMDPDFWVVEIELFGRSIEDFITVA